MLRVNLGGIVRSTDQLTLTADGTIQHAGAISSDKDATVAPRSGSVEISVKLGAGCAGAASGLANRRRRPRLCGSSVNISGGKLTNVDGKVLVDSSLLARTAGDLSNAGTIQSGDDLSLRSAAGVGSI